VLILRKKVRIKRLEKVYIFVFFISQHLFTMLSFFRIVRKYFSIFFILWQKQTSIICFYYYYYYHHFSFFILYMALHFLSTVKYNNNNKNFLKQKKLFERGLFFVYTVTVNVVHFRSNN